MSEADTDHRRVPDRTETKSKNNAFDSDLGITESDRKNLAEAVAVAVLQLPGKTVCNHSDIDSQKRRLAR